MPASPRNSSRSRPHVAQADLVPTACARIDTTEDVMLIVQGCLLGKLPMITRRPHDRERATLIRPGNIFVYTETGSGIKRWTDGVNWSPSRILQNFLVYRELSRPFPPGQKKRATKRGSKRYAPYDKNRRARTPTEDDDELIRKFGRTLTREEERALVGSLNDSYAFKSTGLIKKTVSFVFRNEETFHVVWYYDYRTFLENRLARAMDLYYHFPLDPLFFQNNSFRVPINLTGLTVDWLRDQPEWHTREKVKALQGGSDVLQAASPIVIPAHQNYPLSRYEPTGNQGYQYPTSKMVVDNTNYLPQVPRYSPHHELANSLASTNIYSMPMAGDVRLSYQMQNGFYGQAQADPQLQHQHSSQQHHQESFFTQGTANNRNLYNGSSMWPQ